MTDPTECDHDEIVPTGETYRQDGHLYEEGECVECGAPADKRHAHTGTLVWETDSDDPTVYEAGV